MSKPFDTVVLSTSISPKFSDLWPIVGAAWRKLFDVPVHLAVVGDQCQVPAFDWSHIHYFKPVAGVPIPNQAKLARYYVASNLPDSSVILTNDVDLLPINADFLLRMLTSPRMGTLTTFGGEVYTGKEQGKFMAGYLMAEGGVWRRLFGVNKDCTWNEFVLSFAGLKKFDTKEDVMNAVHHEHPDTFSDESLLRYLVWLTQTAVDYRKAAHYPERMLDRANWTFSPVLLNSGFYVDCHLPRPLCDHADKIKPLTDFLGI